MTKTHTFPQRRGGFFPHIRAYAIRPYSFPTGKRIHYDPIKQFSCRKTTYFPQTIHPNKQNERGTLPETGWHPSLPQSAYSIGCGLNFLTTIVDLTCCKITTKKTFPQSHKKGILHRRDYSLFVSETHRQHPSGLTKHPL